MKIILSFGGGVDSTALAAIDQHRSIAATWLDITENQLLEAYPKPDHVVFSDTGAETEGTYANVKRLGNYVTTVRRDNETIIEWTMRLGNVPLMPQSSHVCSLKFKGEVMAKWAKASGFINPTWLIGIEANEGKRSKRFTKPKGDGSEYRYPLQELGMTRADCIAFLQCVGWIVPPKSSCIFCPFKTLTELKDMHDNHQADWELSQKIEDNFEAMSHIKHQRWLDAGKPVNKAGRALIGMWKKNSYAEGARLFLRTGKSVRQLAAQFKEESSS